MPIFSRYFCIFSQSSVTSCCDSESCPQVTGGLPEGSSIMRMQSSTGHTVQAASHHVGDLCEAFFVHPVGQAVAQVFHNAETIVHYRGTDLQAASAEQQKFGRIAPRGNASHSRDRQLGTTHHRILSKRRQHI